MEQAEAAAATAKKLSVNLAKPGRCQARSSPRPAFPRRDRHQARERPPKGVQRTRAARPRARPLGVNFLFRPAGRAAEPPGGAYSNAKGQTGGGRTPHRSKSPERTRCARQVAGLAKSTRYVDLFQLSGLGLITREKGQWQQGHVQHRRRRGDRNPDLRPRETRVREIRAALARGCKFLAQKAVEDRSEAREASPIAQLTGSPAVISAKSCRCTPSSAKKPCGATTR